MDCGRGLRRVGPAVGGAAGGAGARTGMLCVSSGRVDKWTQLAAGLRDFSLWIPPCLPHRDEDAAGSSLWGQSESEVFPITLPPPGSPQIQPPPANSEALLLLPQRFYALTF
ncbi:unnamed protein product [Rangifer tarandus platyrhynchus]|uniref:Uncharacterized protein n=1 Tax=Rangifer tarandus platyrhynchus TaxID=3082113 RepID=A0AC59Y1F4_RANTA